jgi:hypothetical protein
VAQVAPASAPALSPPRPQQLHHPGSDAVDVLYCTVLLRRMPFEPRTLFSDGRAVRIGPETCRCKGQVHARATSTPSAAAAAASYGRLLRWCVASA